MPTGKTYRDPATTYRDVTTTYRPSAPPFPSIDLATQDYVTMEVVDQYMAHKAWLPAASLQKTSWDLNDSGEASLDMSVVDPAAASLLVNAGNELKVTFHNAIDTVTNQPVVWQGFPVRRERKPGMSTLTLEGIFSYFKNRIVENASLQYTSQDQFDIVWGLLSTAQTGTNYDRNIHASYSPSGVIRSRFYSRNMHQRIYDLAQAFRSDHLQNGFDFIINVDASGNRLWTPAYPNMGSLYNGFVEWGREIVDYDLQDDGSQQATKVYAIGGGQGGVQFEQIYEDVTASSEFGVMALPFNDSSELDLGWLLQVAQHQVSMRKIPVPNYSITVAYSDASPLLGKIHPGDTLWVRIQDGTTNINDTFRIQSIAWQLSPGPALVIQFYQPNLQGYIDPLAEEAQLQT